MESRRTVLRRFALIIGVLLVSRDDLRDPGEDIVNPAGLFILDPILGPWLINQNSLTGNRLFSLITLFGNTLVVSSLPATQVFGWLKTGCKPGDENNQDFPPIKLSDTIVPWPGWLAMPIVPPSPRSASWRWLAPAQTPAQGSLPRRGKSGQTRAAGLPRQSPYPGRATTA